jgi:hypothetical protein
MRITPLSIINEYRPYREALKERLLEARLDNLYALAAEGKDVKSETKDIENKLAKLIKQRKA